MLGLSRALLVSYVAVCNGVMNICLLKDRLVTYRVSKQRLREATTQAVDYLILGLAGVCLGIITKANDTNLGAAGYTYTVIAVCKLEIIATFDMHFLCNKHSIVNFFLPCSRLFSITR